MKGKLWLEIMGMSTAVAALFGTFGILLNIFFQDAYLIPFSGASIVEPHIIVLMIELFLVVVSIPIVIYIGVKNIRGLVRFEKGKDKDSKGIIEEKTPHIFLRVIVLGITLVFIVGLIIYVDEMNYRNQKLNYKIKKMDETITEMNRTIEVLGKEVIDSSIEIRILKEENDMLKNVS